ncbi:MAG TPA: prolyl oligopeptidase family serine peptidase [Verrucomicrobiae bacterium]|nr:prolyl oligopeptidase family serine peptidase [Verrucomicrobiae bacterium]
MNPLILKFNLNWAALRTALCRILVSAIFVSMLNVNPANAAETPTLKKWTVDGVVREALIFAPAPGKTPAPVIFAFHGHGGSMRFAARKYNFQSLWPEALVVYMQGLDTPGRLTDPKGTRTGWQAGAGDQQDRDLKFFDAVLATLKSEYHVDTKRIYATGHSNGGSFTYLLWAKRGETFAAVAPSSAVDSRDFSLLKPKPVFHVAGENDPLVKFSWQQRMINALRSLNQCGAGATFSGDKRCTIYSSKIGAPVVTFIHPGGHEFPEDARKLIVKFFKQHALP